MTDAAITEFDFIENNFQNIKDELGGTGLYLVCFCDAMCSCQQTADETLQIADEAIKIDTEIRKIIERIQKLKETIHQIHQNNYISPK